MSEQETDYCGGRCGACDEKHWKWEDRIAELEAENTRLRDVIRDLRNQSVLAGMKDTPLYGIADAALNPQETGKGTL